MRFPPLHGAQLGRRLRFGDQRKLLAPGLGARFILQALHFLTEGVEDLETAVDRGKARLGHRIEIVQLFHDPLTDSPRGHFAFAAGHEFVTDASDDFLDRIGIHRALFQRA